MNKIRASVLLVIVLGVIGLIGWKMEWFVSTPTSVLTYSLMQANAGNFESACQNLPTGQRNELLANPELQKEFWPRLTKNGTIVAVNVIREDRGINGLFGDIQLAIKYQDGSTFSTTTKISYLHGKWSYGAAEIHHAMREREREREQEEFNALTLPLPAEYRRFEGTPISMRLPKDCVWNKEERRFGIPKYSVSIFDVKTPRMTSVASQLKWIEGQWALPQNALFDRKDQSKGNISSVLFEGESKNDKGDKWRRFYLVVGDANDAYIFGAVAPKQENFLTALRECLASARLALETER